MTTASSIDHARLAKLGFALGLALFLAGAGGEYLGHAVLGGIPAWEDALFFDMEVVGLLVGFFSPFVFGVALPLLE